MDQVGSANDLAGQFLHADRPAQSVLADVDATGLAEGEEVLVNNRP